MSKEEQIIAIAEACGWIGCKNYPIVTTVVEGRVGDGEVTTDSLEGFPCNGKIREKLPNYLGDLTAMHRAENYLLSFESDGSRPNCVEIYNTFLCECVGSVLAYSHILAEAPQKAEAFLKTLGLWKEENAE